MRLKMAGNKVKLLCLHGYTQNASTFYTRVGSLRKGLKSRCEFVFVDAPFECTGLPGAEVNEAQGAETGGRSWWNWQDTGPAARPSLAATYTGWETTQDFLLQAIREHRPDGLLGFSQGATAAALLLACLAKPEVREQLQGTSVPSFSILVAGFVPRDMSYASVLQEHGKAVDTPTLLVHGTGDKLVPWERTEALMQCFNPDSVTVYTHEGAHLVPTCTGAFKQALVEFLDKAAVARQAGQQGSDVKQEAQQAASVTVTA